MPMTQDTEPTPPDRPRGEDPPAARRYRVKLEVFEGPLDLLLHLIRKDELDIFNIPIALITEQYLEYVDLMKELDLEVAGEFILMAATLVHIKTRSLLPRPAEGETGTASEEDPRHELVARLIEHQRYKAASQALYQREIIQDQLWSRPPSPPGPGEQEEPLLEVSLFDLLSTLKDIIERARDRVVIEVEPERFSVNDKIQHIADQLAASTSIAFEALFEDAKSRREIIVTFLALLEMIRLRMIRVLQRAPFAPIWVFRRGEDAEPRAAPESAPEVG